MPLLPVIRTRADRLASPRDEATYVPAIREICRRHGLADDALAKFSDGSTIVFGVGDRLVVKLFEPIYAENAATERAVLAHVHGRLGVPTPGIVAAGELEDWRYVVMDRLPGDTLASVWADVVEADRRALCRRVGEAVARLHALPVDGLRLPYPAWDAFVARQREGCVEQQRSRGLAEAWVEQVPAFLASVDLPPAEPALLHTEIMREHVLVRRGAEGWEVSGVFDFEPAMVGAPEYDFASAGIFLAGGDSALLRAFLLGCGYADADFTAELPRRIMAYALLHRYSNLRWYLETIPPRAATTLDELAAEWFAAA
jgi:hygromycin-B 7''-O-kinase